MRRQIPRVEADQIQPDAAAAPLRVGSPDWFAWLSDSQISSFSYHTEIGAATIRRERKRNGWYWYAYRSIDGTLHKVYIGKQEELTPQHLRERTQRLFQPAKIQPPAPSIQLLGPPTLTQDGTQLNLPSKLFALIGYLALRAQPQSRDQLIGLLWPESAVAAGRKNLRNLLWTLRSLVGSALISGDDRLALQPELWVDLRQFEQLTQELQRTELPSAQRLTLLTDCAKLYQGPLLEGLAFDDAPELELWISHERERLHQSYLLGLNAMIEIYRIEARWNDMLSTARTALAHDPLQESMYRVLMEAYAGLGERAQALRQYDLLETLLARELKIDPLPETVRLRDAIMRGAFLPATPAQTLRIISSTPPTAAPYIGRDDELAALDLQWAKAQSGAAYVSLLIGEAGIGKSSLWQTWAQHLPNQARVWEAQGLEVTRSIPFAPLIELLRGKLLRYGSKLVQLWQRQPPAWLADLSRLLPELRDTLPDLPKPLNLSPDEERRHIFEALVQSFQIGEQRPSILFIDDLHWVDTATLDWLGYLIHRMRQQPFLLIGAYRTDEQPTALQKIMSSWVRSNTMQRIVLDRLNRHQTERLILALGGDIQRADTLYTQSAGNPYFLRELMRAAPEQMPTALVDLISSRLERLPDTARQVIQAAAILQPYSDVSAIWYTSGQSEIETIDAIELLIQHGLLVERKTGLGFGHPLIAHVVDASLSGVRRRMLHQRAIEAWQAMKHHTEQAGRLATHYAEIGDAEQAAHYAEIAGEKSLSIGAASEAGHFYQLATQLAPTPGRHHGLGLAHYWQGNLEEAQLAFVAAHDKALAANDTRSAARACLELARTSLSAGHSAAVLRWINQGHSYLSADDDPSAFAIAEYLLGTGMRASGQSLSESEAHLHESLRYANSADTQVILPGIFFELGNIRAQLGDLAGALEYFATTIKVAQANHDLLHLVLGHNNSAYHATLAGDFAKAHQHIDEGLLLVEERDMSLMRQWVYSTRSELAIAEAEWDTAAHWLERGIGEAERYNNAALHATYQANTARMLWGRGRTVAALQQMEHAHTAALACNESYLVHQIERWLAEWKAT